MNNSEINELFSQFGPMNICKIRYDKLGVSYGIAIVEYKDENHAKKAIKKYNGATLDKEVIKISYAKKKILAEKAGGRPNILKRIKSNKNGG